MHQAVMSHPSSVTSRLGWGVELAPGEPPSDGTSARYVSTFPLAGQMCLVRNCRRCSRHRDGEGLTGQKKTASHLRFLDVCYDGGGECPTGGRRVCCVLRYDCGWQRYRGELLLLGCLLLRELGAYARVSLAFVVVLILVSEISRKSAWRRRVKFSSVS